MERRSFLAASGAAVLASCSHTPTQPTIGVAFDTLGTEYWLASRNAMTGSTLWWHDTQARSRTKTSAER